jgi:Reverse transcriptase (RNA-dependent DNA polymerase).
MLAVVPQGSTLSPLFNNIYKSDIPKSIATELAIYADDFWILN